MKYIAILWGLMNICIAIAFCFGYQTNFTNGLGLGSAAGYAIASISLALKS